MLFFFLILKYKYSLCQNFIVVGVEMAEIVNEHTKKKLKKKRKKK